MENKQLESFIKYCKEHPDERFWQALRNWSEYDFIFGKKYEKTEFINDFLDKTRQIGLEDTFYKE